MSERLIVSVRWTRTRFRRRLTENQRQAIMRAVLRAWLDTGEWRAGFAAVVSWRNPDNRKEIHREWKEVDSTAGDDDALEAARTTLNQGGWLSAKVGGMRWPRA